MVSDDPLRNETEMSPQTIEGPGSDSELYFDATHRCLFAIEMLGKYDVLVELHMQSGLELQKIMDGFRERFVGKYAGYDVSTITKEYLVVWGPFAEGV